TRRTIPGRGPATDPSRPASVSRFPATPLLRATMAAPSNIAPQAIHARRAVKSASAEVARQRTPTASRARTEPRARPPRRSASRVGRPDPAHHSAPSVYEPTMTAQPTKLPTGTPSHAAGGVHRQSPSRTATGSMARSTAIARRAAASARRAGVALPRRTATAMAHEMTAAHTATTARGTPPGATGEMAAGAALGLDGHAQRRDDRAPDVQGGTGVGRHLELDRAGPAGVLDPGVLHARDPLERSSAPEEAPLHHPAAQAHRQR